MGLREMLGEHGVEVLAEPQGECFESVVAKLTGEKFGAIGSFNQLQPHWQGVEVGAAQELQRLAEEAGRSLAERYNNVYNGTLPRLEKYFTDGKVLKLDLGATSFLTWKVTTGNPHLEERLRDATRVGGLKGVSGAHHLPLTMSCVTADNYIVVMQRASGMAVHPDSYTSSANGNIDLEAHDEHSSDIRSGRLDLYEAMIREAREELGGGCGVDKSNLKARMLIRYSDSKETDAPVLVFTARTDLKLDEFMFGLRYAHPTEGIGELGRHVLAIPRKPQDPEAVLAFIRGEHLRGALTAPGLVSSILNLELETASQSWDAAPSALRPQEILKLPVVIPPQLQVGTGY